MSCKPSDKKPEKEPVGFFASLFGGGSSEESSSKCPGGCGQERCNCNCALKAHLKECCGLGTLPELTVCSKIQQQMKGDAPVAKTVDNTCEFPPVDLDCMSKIKRGGGGGACSAKDKDRDCPPLPETDTLACIPIWLCPEPSKRKTYPAPKGAVILPISVGARNTSKKPDAKCTECGTITKNEVPEAKVTNKACPALRPETPCAPKKVDEPKECGIMNKIRSIFFGSGGDKN